MKAAKAVRVKSGATRTLGLALVGALLLIASSVAVLTASVNLPPVRAYIVRTVNDMLAKQFVGSLQIVRFARLNLRGVQGLELRAFDAHGRRVLDARGVSATMPWPRLVWDLIITPSAPLKVHISSVVVDHVDVSLFDDGSGAPTLTQAFVPRGAPEGLRRKDAARGEATGSTSVIVDRIELAHAWAHGELGQLPSLDVELVKGAASLQEDVRGFGLAVSDVELYARALPGSVDAIGHLRGRLKVGGVGPAEAEAHFEGEIASIRTKLVFRLEHGVIAVQIDAEATTEALARVTPALRLQGPIRLSARANGAWPDLTFRAELDGAAGRLETSGTLDLREPVTVKVALHGAALDLAEILPQGPASRLTFDLSVAAMRTDGGVISGSYELKTAPSEVLEHAVPQTTARGTLHRGADSVRVDGSVAVDEPGAATTVEFSLRRAGSSEFEARSSTTLQNSPRLSAIANGLQASGKLEARVHWDLGQNTIDGRIQTRLRDVRYHAVSAAQLHIEAEASGRLTSPEFDVTGQAEGVNVGQRSFSSVWARLNGTKQRAHITARVAGEGRRELYLSSDVALHREPALTNLKLALKRDGQRLTARARSVAMGGGRLRIEGLELVGAGHVELSLTLGDALEQLELRTQALDVARLAQAWGLDSGLSGGVVTLDARLVRGSQGLKGHLRFEADALAFGGISGGALRGKLTVRAGKATGEFLVRLGKAGRTKIRLNDVDIVEPPFTLAQLNQVRGALSMEGALDLAELMPLVQWGSVPIERVSGNVEFNVELQKDGSRQAWPEITAQANTHALEVVGKRMVKQTIQTVELARDAEPWMLTGVDFQTRLKLDGNDGKLRLSVVARDKAGEIVSADARTQAPKLRRDELRDLTRLLLETPIVAQASVPTRSLRRFPEMLRIPELLGQLELEAEFVGTISDPKVDVRASIDQMHGLATEASALDINARAAYSRTHGEVELSASSQDRQVAMLTSSWRGEFLDLLKEPRSSRSPVRGNAKLVLDAFPIEAVPELQLRGLAGIASGQVVLEGFGENAQASGRLEARCVRAGEVRLPSISANVRAADGALEARMDLVSEQGSLHADLRSALRWGGAALPELGDQVEGKVLAKHFRIALFKPLFAGSLSELDGHLNADVVARLHGATSVLEGTAEVHGGVVQHPMLGQRLSDVNGKAVFEPGRVRLSHLSARGTTGKVTGTGAAEMQGLSLRSATGTLVVKKTEKIPITLQGVGLGEAWGRVDGSFRAASSEVNTLILVDVKQLHVSLPETDTHGVQDLEPAPDVRVGVRRGDGVFVTLPLQPLAESTESIDTDPVIVRIKLGPEVWIERGTELKVRIQGRVRLHVDEEVRATGQIQLASGTIDVSGKRFKIESGIVTFDGAEPTNPTIVATARWDSPADYRVYAEYVGSVEDGRLTLRAEPPLPQDKILSLLLFGSPDGSLGAGSGSGNATATAAAVGGGTATRGLNRIISGITDLDVDARVDTSTGSARPELVLQVTRRLSARVTRALGEPPPGQPPDRTFLTLDLRIAGRWFLSTTIGDRGASAIEVIWRRHY